MTQPTTGSLHEQAIASLGARIVTGHIPVGTVLTPESVGISRTVLRECIRVLESLGLVQARRRRGTVVLPAADWQALDPRVLAWRLAGPDRLTTLSDLSELRLAVEPVAARLASTRATPDQCGALTAAIVGMSATQRSADHDEYLAHDRDFHRILLEASGNPLFAALSGAVAEALSGRTTHALMPHTANPEAIRLHEDVAAAVRRGDAVAAENGMRAIVEEADAAVQRPAR
ncbi:MULTISPECIES: FadR/GntR family transcriptional regulator [unclassified Leifsonia]|uniref:FadR/GntR family transcriptional regulator n=1 Tax=unclassified Leifsonia TaxID=2663824 RepID=UPI0008A745BA|nr:MULTISPECIES: FadR/GntR family transcriptional regulator [unclassified Leifsonia]SEH99376.1 DNA-binding transcriptional regulator, FadR family [Leifsonia sp. CL154]SFL68231.1 DNA-binding transcriptional regulator, FadR family [Leifsonia sp. CL147]